MLQSFTTTARPDLGADRLAALRTEMAREGLGGFLIPRADVHQGEYVARRDERLAWLTGFTGSAGFCVALTDQAGVFIDGRYRTQIKGQVDLAAYTPVPWPETQPGPWITERTKDVIGYDPWLHTHAEITKLRDAGVHLRPVTNLVDRIWDDQPDAPMGQTFVQPESLAGRSAADKRADLAATMGAETAVITLPDSLAWLLNIRGSDVPRNPVPHGFALLHKDATVDLFIAPEKVGEKVRAHLGPDVRLHAPDDIDSALRRLTGPVRLDAATAPIAIRQILLDCGTKIVEGDDPCRLPKARKTEAELQGMREAHLRDGAAVVEFLAWLDRTAPGDLTEISVVEALEGFRRATNALHDISFETICGAGPNGAIMHYRVTHDSDRKIENDQLLLVDSGAQYVDGTTDITRTIAIGDPGDEARDCYTRVLRGLIAVSRARWPKGLAGRDLDALARFPLWVDGRDYDHGTGHGVGAFLSVHEGPQRIARISEVPLEPGMILSNEPGYYREGAFGIRLENLIAVEPAPRMADDRTQLRFETLTFVPFDRRLILTATLSAEERAWIDAYHAEVAARIAPRVGDAAKDWLIAATQPLVG
ncbi:aminopeptidase P family protein [Falsirhodobacter halotolerans]|uniref:aminopeptidase P family protein n=1 Tax=Falsirhodobacter halotolerans TaxID=1146892 RepID=UPI001FD038AF|nr:aminopeptidase P family protein [Falsirhodobacter halotolerans]MCJ8139389.1 aminopeptidase P family protein [Falsirhodobacter halotolerans]